MYLTHNIIVVTEHIFTEHLLQVKLGFKRNKQWETGKHPKRYLLGNSYMSDNPSSNKNRCRHLPGVLVTSLSSSKSKSKVGGWCCLGQLDTAAVSCSNRMIQTSIRPGKQKADLSEIQL